MGVPIEKVVRTKTQQHANKTIEDKIGSNFNNTTFGDLLLDVSGGRGGHELHAVEDVVGAVALAEVGGGGKGPGTRAL